MRVFLTNLGCKLNQAENDRLARRFAEAGHRIATSLDDADLHVVNSCTVTAEAARGSRKAARAGVRRAAGAPPRTVLTGCWATASPAEAAALPGVDLVVPNRDKESLVEAVLAALPADLSAPEPLPAGVPPPAAVPAAPGASALARAPGGPFHTRAFLKVEDGCDMRCSFCIIPTTRGRQRSRPLPEVLAEARAMVEAGHREIVLTGVQISAYRPAGSPGSTAPALTAPAPPAPARRGAPGLLALVEALLAELPAAGARLRLTSIAPWQLDAALLALWTDRRLCRHLHLSLQSGAARTLRRMRRPYTPEGFHRLVEMARAAIPGVAITTDVIVGFPGETDAEAAESLRTVAALGFAKVHVFPFSPRPGTAAARLPGALPSAEQRRRMEEMLHVAARCDAEFRTGHLGRRATVLWERPGAGGRGQGLTDNYIRVWCDEAAALWNQLSEVELTALEAGATGATGGMDRTGGLGGMTGRLIGRPPGALPPAASAARRR